MEKINWDKISPEKTLYGLLIELKDKLNELIEEREEINRRWKDYDERNRTPAEPQPAEWPEKGDPIWYVTDLGDVVSDPYPFQALKSIGNCFHTKEEAEKHKKRLEYLAKNGWARNFIDQNIDPLSGTVSGK
jgi:hypothetical protein